MTNNAPTTAVPWRRRRPPSVPGGVPRWMLLGMTAAAVLLGVVPLVGAFVPPSTAVTPTRHAYHHGHHHYPSHFPPRSSSTSMTPASVPSCSRGFTASSPLPQPHNNKRIQRLRLYAVGKTGGRVLASPEEFHRVVWQTAGSHDDSEEEEKAVDDNANDADQTDGSKDDGNDNDRPVLVFFTAPWCGPCRLSIPVVKEVGKDFAQSIDMVEVCTDDLPGVAAEAGIVSIPTIQMYYKGKVLDTIVGCVAKSVLRTAVEKVLEDVSAGSS